MNFPYTRHEQRYEFILNKGYVTDKHVIDVGGGSGYGARTLSALAHGVVCIDIVPIPEERFLLPSHSMARLDRVRYHCADILNCKLPATQITKDVVAVCVEILEHTLEPEKFVAHIATLCNYAFFTTPLAAKTGPTRNPDHVAEYSKADFLRILRTGFDVLEYYNQTGDLRIVKKAPFRGDSHDFNHVVQMAWCRRRE